MAWSTSVRSASRRYSIPRSGRTTRRTGIARAIQPVSYWQAGDTRRGAPGELLILASLQVRQPAFMHFGDPGQRANIFCVSLRVGRVSFDRAGLLLHDSVEFGQAGVKRLN